MQKFRLILQDDGLDQTITGSGQFDQLDQTVSEQKKDPEFIPKQNQTSVGWNETSTLTETNPPQIEFMEQTVSPPMGSSTNVSSNQNEQELGSQFLQQSLKGIGLANFRNIKIRFVAQLKSREQLRTNLDIQNSLSTYLWLKRSHWLVEIPNLRTDRIDYQQNFQFDSLQNIFPPNIDFQSQLRSIPDVESRYLYRKFLEFSTKYSDDNYSEELVNEFLYEPPLFLMSYQEKQKMRS